MGAPANPLAVAVVLVSDAQAHSNCPTHWRREPPVAAVARLRLCNVGVEQQIAVGRYAADVGFKALSGFMSGGYHQYQAGSMAFSPKMAPVLASNMARP